MSFANSAACLLLTLWCLCLQVPSDRYQGVTAANLVHKSGANTTAVVYEDSAYGYGLAFNFIAGFTKGTQAAAATSVAGSNSRSRQQQQQQ
jgi:ABC-type branched-subunit amino acid transport system substrate-binding protein